MEERKALYNKYITIKKEALNEIKNGNLLSGTNLLKEASIMILNIAKETTKTSTKEQYLNEAKQLITLRNSILSKIAKKEQQDLHDGIDTSTSELISKQDTGISFDDVIGLDSVKKALEMRILFPIKYPDIYQQYDKKSGGGVLLYGPPGTGKTLIAKALASEIDAAFYIIKCSDIFDKYVGEAEKKIKNLFNDARKQKNAVIFFDEMDALTQARSDDSSGNRVVAELLAQIDGFDTDNSNLLFLGATNLPWNIDPAILRPKRFGDVIFVPLPNLADRSNIFKLYCDRIDLIEPLDYDMLAKISEGYSGADIYEIIEQAKNIAIERTIQSGVISNITMEDMLSAIQKRHRSVNDQLYNNYVSFEQLHQGKKDNEIIDVKTDIEDVVDDQSPITDEVNTDSTYQEKPEQQNSNNESNENDDIDAEELTNDFTLEAEPYNSPSIDLLETYEHDESYEDHEENIRKLINALSEYKIEIKDMDYQEGASYTLYSFKLPNAVSIASVRKISEELAMRAKIENLRVLAPIPGKDLIGLEVSKSKQDTVFFKETITLPSKSKDITIPIGKDVFGTTIYKDIFKAPHTLVAGATGSGKSVHLNSLISGIIFNYSPEDVRLLVLDPKRVEFSMYRNIPHMIVKDPIKEDIEIMKALKYAEMEMENRYDLLEKNACRNIDEYNKKVTKKIPKILVIIDEVADLLSGSLKSQIETSIVRLGQKARAAGISVYIAAQRPSADIVTARIKANFPYRIAFKGTNRHDSTTIINESGSEKLIGKGDLLMLDDMKLSRLQGVFIHDENIDRLVKYIKSNNTPIYNKNIHNFIFN